MLGVGSCDGMSRAKHRLGRGITGSDRRDPPTVLLIRKKAENVLKLSESRAPLRAEFPSDFDRVCFGGGLREVNFSNP